MTKIRASARSGRATSSQRRNGPRTCRFGHDALAAGALMECQRRAILVPQQPAIIGFADLDIAEAIEPALSSVRVPTRARDRRKTGTT